MVVTSSQNPPKRNPSPAQKGGQGVKMLITTVSLASILGGWAMLSAERTQASKDTRPATLAPRATATAGVALHLPPLPTLVPPPTGLPALPTQMALPTPLPQPTLRVVNQAPPQRVVHVGGGGGGGGGGDSGPAPAAQTGSSK